MPTYCNITTDLQDVFSRIEEYQAKEIIENWTNVSGTIYKKAGTGHVAMVFWNGTKLTAGTTTSPSAGQYYYDSSNDVLYVNNSADPASHTVEVGTDWTTFKTTMRNRAQMIVDAYLNTVYTTPLLPRDRKTHDANAYYEWFIIEATACLTCSFIIKRVRPNDPNGALLFKRAINPDPQPGESKGILDMIKAGELVRQDQITAREVGNWSIFAASANTVTDSPQLMGTYTGSMYKVWRIQIDTGGAPGTGTYKVSYDGGTTWDLTVQDMKDADNDEYRMSIADGIYIYWPNITWVVDEYWDVELYPMSDSADISKIGSIRIYR